MKKVKTNLNRISVCIVIFSTVLCWTVYAGELGPVCKKTLPPWWEDGFEHQNFNPEMFDNLIDPVDVNNPQSGSDEWPDGWEYFGSGSFIEYIDSGEVKIQLPDQEQVMGQLSQVVNNAPDEIKFKEFAFRLRFKTQDSFCPDTGTALATFFVSVSS